MLSCCGRPGMLRGCSVGCCLRWVAWLLLPTLLATSWLWQSAQESVQGHAAAARHSRQLYRVGRQLAAAGASPQGSMFTQAAAAGGLLLVGVGGLAAAAYTCRACRPDNDRRGTHAPAGSGPPDGGLASWGSDRGGVPMRAQHPPLSPAAALPGELWRRVGAYLPVREHCALASTCRSCNGWGAEALLPAVAMAVGGGAAGEGGSALLAVLGKVRAHAQRRVLLGMVFDDMTCVRCGDAFRFNAAVGAAQSGGEEHSDEQAQCIHHPGVCLLSSGYPVVYTWSCCGAPGPAPGCMAAPTHMCKWEEDEAANGYDMM